MDQSLLPRRGAANAAHEPVPKASAGARFRRWFLLRLAPDPLAPSPLGFVLCATFVVHHHSGHLRPSAGTLFRPLLRPGASRIQYPVTSIGGVSRQAPSSQWPVASGQWPVTSIQYPASAGPREGRAAPNAARASRPASSTGALAAGLRALRDLRGPSSLRASASIRGHPLLISAPPRSIQHPETSPCARARLRRPRYRAFTPFRHPASRTHSPIPCLPPRTR